MQPLQWEHRPDGLRAPALVCAFKGWNDAADAASLGDRRSSATALGAQRFATIDPEEFYDFQATRPRIKLVEGQTREIVWPAVELYEARVPRAPRDLILLAGTEPSFRWRTFSKLDRRARRGARRPARGHARRAARRRAAHAAGLGHRPRLRPGARRPARPRARPPTRARPGSSASCTPPASEAGLPSASLWAAVPHYVAATPNPKAALALVRKLEGLVGVAVDAPSSRARPADYERQVNLAVQCDPDVQAFVERLEQAAERRGRRATPGRCRPATRSPATSSASCASAAATSPPAG